MHLHNTFSTETTTSYWQCFGPAPKHSHPEKHSQILTGPVHIPVPYPSWQPFALSPSIHVQIHPSQDCLCWCHTGVTCRAGTDPSASTFYSMAALIQMNQTLHSFLRSAWLASRAVKGFSRGLRYRMNCLFIINTVKGLNCCSASHRLSSPESIPITELAALPSRSFLPYTTTTLSWNNFLMESFERKIPALHISHY